MALPPCPAGEREEDYNKKVVADLEGALLLDRQTIPPLGQTTRIEVCDVLSAEGELIHVKLGLLSKTLSHLFNQGLVSAETMRRLPPFCDQVMGLCRDIDPEAQAELPDISAWHRVTYAIVAKWGGRSLSEALPFFSKLTLRHAAQELRVLSFEVCHRRVELVA